MNFWTPFDYINRLIDIFLAFLGIKKDHGPKIQQTIDNRKKKISIDIQIGGIKNYYQTVEQKVPLKESTNSTTSVLLESDDQEIEEAVKEKEVRRL